MNLPIESIVYVSGPGCFKFKHPLNGQFIEVTYDKHCPKSHDEAVQRLRAKKTEAVMEVANHLGREPTSAEIMQGFVKAKDSRSASEKMADSDWRPKLNQQPGAIERMLAETNEQIEKENRYKGMSTLEARAYDLEQLLDREAEEKLVAEAKAKHLAKIQPKVDVVEKILHRENWDHESDERYRSLLRRTLAQLKELDGDRVETLKMLKQIDAYEETRRQNQLAGLQQQADALAAQQEIINQQKSALSEGMDNASDAE